MIKKILARLHVLHQPMLYLGLVVWMLNDFFWKEAYHSWWTGKLSDFAGMLVLPMLIYVVVGGKRYWSLLAASALFAWWKSPWSQSVIDFVNESSTLHLVRVVDWTDLMAFVMLPMAYHLMGRRGRSVMYYQLLKWAPLGVGLFMIVATSDEDLPPNEANTSRCCSVEGTVNEWQGTRAVRYAIAGAFSPDGDGVNDLFTVHVDSTVRRIDSFAIFRLRGFELVHFVDRIDQPEVVTWDGWVDGGPLNERFTYQMKLHSTSDSTFWIAGYVCSITCTVENDLPPSEAGLNHCGWPSQFVRDSMTFDLSLPTGEEFDCL